MSHYISECAPPPSFDNGQYAMFVTWKIVYGGEPHLRGGIGIECTVSILTECEVEANYLDWEVGKHGIDIDFNDLENTRRRTTHFP